MSKKDLPELELPWEMGNTAWYWKLRAEINGRIRAINPNVISIDWSEQYLKQIHEITDPLEHERAILDAIEIYCTILDNMSETEFVEGIAEDMEQIVPANLAPINLYNPGSQVVMNYKMNSLTNGNDGALRR